jgi:hypothetical protein
VRTAAGVGKGALRSTAARLWRVGLAVVVGSIVTLGTPVAALGAAQWSREVRFPATEAGTMTWVDNLRPIGTTQCFVDAHDANGIVGSPIQLLGMSSGQCTAQGQSKLVLPSATLPTAYIGSVVHMAGGIRVTSGGGATRYVSLLFCSNVQSGSGCTEISRTTAAWTTSTSWVSYAVPPVAIPAGTQHLEISWGGNGQRAPTDGTGLYIVLEVTGTGGSDCQGVVGAGTSPGLTWGSPGLSSTTHDAWGDNWTAESEGGCYFARDGFFNYYAPEGFTNGDTHDFGVQIASMPGRIGRILVQWASVANLTWQTILDFRVTGASGGAIGPGATIVKSNFPAGPYDHIRVIVYSGTILEGLLMSNVEGDPILDDGSGGTGAPPPDYFVGCTAPPDWTDLGADLGWVGCLLSDGFSFVVDTLLSIPVAIANAVSDALYWLFVPQTLGDSWSTFWDSLTDRVPFGWVAQGVTAMAGVGSVSGASVTWSFTIAGVVAAIPFGEFAASAEPYRGWFAAVVVAGTVVTVWRSVTGSGDDGKAAL